MSIHAFLSSRLWLSIIAGLVGGMLAWIEASWRMTTPYSAGRVVAVDGTLHLAGALALAVFWLYIFFRRPGRPIVLDSRQALSVGALFFGAIALRILLYYRVLDPAFLEGMSANGLTVVAAGLFIPLLFWVGLFFSSRQYKVRTPKGIRK